MRAIQTLSLLPQDLEPLAAALFRPVSALQDPSNDYQGYEAYGERASRQTDGYLLKAHLPNTLYRQLLPASPSCICISKALPRCSLFASPIRPLYPPRGARFRPSARCLLVTPNRAAPVHRPTPVHNRARYSSSLWHHQQAHCVLIQYRALFIHTVYTAP